MGNGQFSASGDFQLRRIVSGNPPRSRFRAESKKRKAERGEKKEREKKEKEKEKGKGGEGGKNSIRSIRRLTMKREGETSGDRGDVCVRLKVG